MFTCSVCKDMAFDNADDFSSHLASEEHLQLDAISGSTEEIGLMCDICNVKFSGVVPYEQHFKSKRHNKKVKELKISQIMKENYVVSGPTCSKKSSDFNDMLSTNNCNYSSENMKLGDESYSGTSAPHHKQMWSCDVCRKLFPDSVTFNDHFSQDDHMRNQRKCEEKATLQNGYNSGNINFSNEKELNLDDERESLVQENLNTSDCDMFVFSEGNGTEEILPENSFSSSSSHQVDFFCEVCKIACTGFIPYSEHMISKKHKKEQEMQELLHKIADSKSGRLSLDHSMSNEGNEYLTSPLNKSPLSDVDATSLNNNLSAFANIIRCEICNVPCSGVIPYQQHMSSQRHIKELEKKRRLDEFMKNASITPGNDHCNFEIKKHDEFECSETNTSINSIVFEKSQVNGTNGDLIFFNESSSSSSDSFANSSIDEATSANVYICHECNISCTGIVPYTQHMSSAKHKKMCQTKKLLEQHKNKLSVSQTEVAECCANATQMGQLMAEVGNASLEDLSHLSNNQIEDKQNLESLASTESISGSQTIFSDSIICSVCEICCSGLIPFQQHLHSQKHSKCLERKKILQTLSNSYTEKMQVNENTFLRESSGNESSRDSSDSSLNLIFNSQDSCTSNCNNDQEMFSNVLKCDACKTSFSGIIPYNQHMKSNKHKKQLEKLTVLQTLQKTQNSNSLPSKHWDINQDSTSNISTMMETCTSLTTALVNNDEIDESSNKMKCLPPFSKSDSETEASVIVLDDKLECAKCGIVGFVSETDKIEHFHSKEHLQYVSLKDYEVDSECSSMHSSLSASLID